MRVAHVAAGGLGAGYARALSDLGMLACSCDAGAAGDPVGALAGSGDFGAAVLAVPAGMRAQAARRLLDAGKHVLVVGPASPHADWQGPAREAARRGVVLAFGLEGRFCPGVADVRRRLGGGDLGEAVLTEIRRDGAACAPPPPGGGEPDDGTVDSIDVANLLFGGAPTVVSARTGAGGIACVMLGYGPGRTALLVSNPGAARDAHTVGVTCTRGHVLADLLGGTAGPAGRLRPGGDGMPPGAPVRAEPRPVPLIRGFAAAVAGGEGGSVAGPAEALNAARAAEAALLSGEKCVPIHLDLR